MAPRRALVRQDDPFALIAKAFVQSECVADPTVRTASVDLWFAYQRWWSFVDRPGLPTQTGLGIGLSALGFVRKKSDRLFWQGLRLRSPRNPPDPPKSGRVS